jgi:hypothetical protein
VIVQVILPLSTLVEASATVAGQSPEQGMALLPEKLVSPPPADSAQGRRGGSSWWILAGALAGVDGRLLAGDAVPAHLDDDPLDAQSGCVPCQLCLVSDALDESTLPLRDRTEAARSRP